MYLKITFALFPLQPGIESMRLKNIYEHFFPHFTLLGRWRDIGGIISFKKFEPRGGGHISES